jgi:polysaccharide export outer membrane protein
MRDQGAENYRPKKYPRPVFPLRSPSVYDSALVLLNVAANETIGGRGDKAAGGLDIVEGEHAVSVRGWLATGLLALMLGLGGCGTKAYPPLDERTSAVDAPYLIGPGDTIRIDVWRNPELSVTIPVRPDGKISSPLVEDLWASDKTSTQLARDIEKVLAKYVRDPVVTVIVTNFGGVYRQQIRVIGEATTPQALPYRENMTLLDVMIAVGGITDFADGNKASVVRSSGGSRQQFGVRLKDLVKGGDLSANVAMRPGDILIIPQSFF